MQISSLVLMKRKTNKEKCIKRCRISTKKMNKFYIVSCKIAYQHIKNGDKLKMSMICRDAAKWRRSL